MKDIYSNILRQMLLELSDSAKKKVKEKFKKEEPTLTDGVMDYYIGVFEKYSASSKFPKKDIFQYTFKELEKIVDANYSEETIKATGEDKVDFKGGEDVVYNDNGLLILKGDLKEKCIRYGKGYSWCISRSDTSNMFTSYRYRMNEPAFYFVFDEDKPKTDVWHAIVIYVDADKNYHVATSDNPGDKEMSWGEIESKQPKLKGLQNLFKHVPLTKEEKDFYEKYKEGITEMSEWVAMSFDEKEKFISIFPDKVNEELLSEAPKELLSKYAITTEGEALNNELYNKLSNSDKKKLKSNIENNHGSFFKYKLYHEIDFTKEDLHIEGNMTFPDTKRLKSLPDNMTVTGYLYIDTPSLKELPKNLTVGEFLAIARTQVDKLPKSLKVGGYIHLPSKLGKIYGEYKITQEEMLLFPEALSESVKLNRLKSN